MIYFTADLHFGHKSILSLCNRPFDSLEEMDEALIRNWNKKVKRNDTVYVVGDFAWKKETVDRYLQALNGKKILVIGNHDKWTVDDTIGSGFSEKIKYEEVSLNGHPVTLCHYPMVEWKNSRKEGSSRLGYLIYGHIHNNIKPEYRQLFLHENALNAGVDINGFTPVSFDELVANNAAFRAFALKQLDDYN